MVQRKVVNKLSIRADHVKYKKLKPSSLEHQDTKNRAADMKKKIKRSRSIKHSDIECLSTPSSKRQVPQPGKPPPSSASPVKTSENMPNYMKSTTSSDARKEKSQVSSRNLLPLFDSKSSSKRNFNSSEASFHKSPRTPARPSSLKLVRTLTKTTNFKPARASSNKCSPLALSENLNVQRATCSSTLKDSKFPEYPTLNPGGSEAEGTSAMKVCPYTYCSLNGHHHPPLPLLKSFLSARRRMLKSQRSIKLGCLSPRRSKPTKDAIEECEKGKVNFDDNSSSAAITPVTQQEHDDFFIHIYTKERETVAGTSATGKSEKDDLLPSNAPPNYHAFDSQVRETLLEKFPLSEIGCHDTSNENGDMETSEHCPEKNQDNQEEDEVHPHFLAAEKSDNEEESTGSILLDDLESGNSDMDWEGGKFSTCYLDDEADKSSKYSQDYDLAGGAVEYDSFVIRDDTVNSCFEGIQAGEIQAKTFDVESMSSNSDFHQDFEIDEHVQGSGEQSYDQLEFITMEASNGDIKKSNFVESTLYISMNPLGNPVMEPWADLEAKAKEDNDIAKVHPQIEDASIQTEVDAFIDYRENKFLQGDDADEQTCHLDSQDRTAQSSTEECSQINFQASSGNTPAEKEDSEPETNSTKINSEDAAAKQKEQDGPFTANITIEIVITLQDSSEAAKMKSRKDAEENHIHIDGKSNQTAAHLDLSAGTQDKSSDEKFIGDSIKNLSSLEEHKGENFTFCESTDSGDQSHSPTTELSLADHTERDLQNEEMETTSSLGEEIYPASASDSTFNSGAQDYFMEMEDNSDEEQSKTCKKLNWTNKRKMSTEEQEGTGEFNPRAPNFLPLEPEQGAEKVDLRHQMIDDRRNSEEWMLDYALQQAVHKLAPARKKKVALLVEAFEKVMPIPNCDTQMRHASVGFAQSPRPIQACS